MRATTSGGSETGAGRGRQPRRAPGSTDRQARPTVVAIYFPAWHRYAHLDAWKGEGWTEWELVKTAPPRFTGHYQPLRPTWGCFDEADPRWAEREIDLAADHGVDVFLYDWYWYSGVQIMQEALHRGFLQARNRRRLRFALMWANHHWTDYFPARQGRAIGECNMWLPCRHSPADLARVVDYCAEQYFSQPNYWRVNGRPFLSIYAPKPFIEQLGGPQRTRQLLRGADAQLTARGLPPIHWNAMSRRAEEVPLLQAAGFTSTASYNVFRSQQEGAQQDPLEGSRAKRGNGMRVPYPAIMDAHRRVWASMAETALPYLPVVTLGWDATPRTEHGARWPFPPTQRAYPYTHVVVGNTPARFGALCRDARAHLAAARPRCRAVIVNAWNEWTEGCYLLPEQRYGTGYLEALREAFATPHPG